MTSISWWRSWHGAPTDLKWSVVAARSGVKPGIVSAIAWALFDHASQAQPRGNVAGFDIETYAVYSGFSQDEINAVIQAMTAKGIIIDGELANWSKRQPEREDNSAARVAAYRARKVVADEGVTQRNATSRDVTQRNATSRDVTQCNATSRDVTQCNAPDKDTDKDTDKEREESGGALTQFETIQQAIEEVTGMPGTPAAVKAIDELVAMGATKEDIAAGYEWLRSNGRVMRYYSQLVGPAGTAYAKRIQEGRGGAGSGGRKRTYKDADGNLIEVNV